MLLDPPPLPTCCPPVSVGRTFPGEWGHKGELEFPLSRPCKLFILRIGMLIVMMVLVVFNDYQMVTNNDFSIRGV